MTTSLAPKGGTCSTPEGGTRMGRNQTVSQRETPIELAQVAFLALAQALNESLCFVPTRQQAGGAHLVQGGRGGVADRDQQLVPARPIDRQRRVGGGDGVFALRAVLR